MYGRAGLDRFKKARTVEPFSVSDNVLANNPKPATQPVNSGYQNQVPPAVQVPVAAGPTPHVTQLGGGQSNWQPPDWAIEPRPGVYYLEVIKDGEVLDRINLDKRRHIFGRQVQACDFVLDHQSVSRQHAAVITHKNGSIYVIDLGSAHGTFVANERLTKDSPVELEAGQSLKFAASTRTYILRKNNAALFPPQPDQTEINLPPPPDPLDEEAVLAYNTFLNRYGLAKPNSESKSTVSGTVSLERNDGQTKERASKRSRRTRVVFKDQVGGELVEVVGVSDGYDVETEPGPVGVKEGSLVGKYESLVKITVIPKGKEQSSAAAKEGSDSSQTGVTEKLKQVFDKVKTPTTKSGIYDDLYGDLYSAKVGSSWAYSSNIGSNGSRVSATIDSEKRSDSSSSAAKGGNQSGTVKDESDDDDLFG